MTGRKRPYMPVPIGATETQPLSQAWVFVCKHIICSGTAHSHGDILWAYHLQIEGWESSAMPVEWQACDGQA